MHANNVKIKWKDENEWIFSFFLFHFVMCRGAVLSRWKMSLSWLPFFALNVVLCIINSFCIQREALTSLSFKLLRLPSLLSSTFSYYCVVLLSTIIRLIYSFQRKTEKTEKHWKETELACCWKTYAKCEWCLKLLPYMTLHVESSNVGKKSGNGNIIEWVRNIRHKSKKDDMLTFFPKWEWREMSDLKVS